MLTKSHCGGYSLQRKFEIPVDSLTVKVSVPSFYIWTLIIGPHYHSMFPFHILYHCASNLFNNRVLDTVLQD